MTLSKPFTPCAGNGGPAGPSQAAGRFPSQAMGSQQDTALMNQKKEDHQWRKPFVLINISVDAGVWSRREADRLIEAGKVLVDGQTASMGMKVAPGQTVVCDGKTVGGKDKPVFLAVNKPRGIVCTTSDKDQAENIVEFLNYPQRIYPVGRLDKDSEGLLLMTNQGDIVNKILRGGNNHEKEYAVAVNHPVTEEFLQKMREGVWIEDLAVKTKPCKAWKTGPYTFHIILTQGLNRADPPYVPGPGFPCKALKTGADHEHHPGRTGTGPVPGADGGRGGRRSAAW